MPIYFWQGGQIVGWMGCGKGQGGGGWRDGAMGWAKGGGVRGVEFIFKWSFLQNRYRYFRLGCRNSRYDTKSYTKSWGIPDFGGIPVVMTSRSRKYVIISPKKVRKQEGERFQLIIYARRSSHLENLNMWVSLRIFKLKYFINEWTPGLEIFTGT